MFLYQPVYKRQTSCLTANRGIADPRKQLVLIIAALVEFGYYSPPLPKPETGNGHVQEAPHFIHGVKIILPDVLEQLGNRKQSPCIEPFGEMVPGCMIFERLIRNGKQLLLKALQVSGNCYRLHCFGILEYKRAECKVLDNKISKLEGQRF